MGRCNIGQELASEVGQLARYRAWQKILKSCTKRRSHLSFETLRDTYKRLTSSLNLKFPECCIKTETEDRVFQALRCATNLKFERSFWIVNRNVDFFCPAIGALRSPILKGQKIDRARLMRGLAVEVDGPIHDTLSKSRKDETKYRFLHNLEIGISVIENGELYEPTVRALIGQLRNTPRLDTRARRRLLRKIYLSTIVYHADHETLAGLYGQAFTEVRE